MEKAVLFFDIDGTILSEKTRTIPQSAVTALQMAKKAGQSAAYRQKSGECLLTAFCADAGPICSSMMKN